MKNLLVVVLILFISIMMIQAEWNHAETVFNFANDDSILVGGYGSLSGKWYKSNDPHGIVVDPNGRFWVAMHNGYGPDISGEIEFIGTNRNGEYDTCHYKPLYCFNPDGSPAPFSPITILSFPDGGSDTLYAESYANGSGKGISLANDGNILYTAFSTVYLIDYQTGAGIARFIPTSLGSMTEAVQDPENGFIYVGYVVPSNRPLYMLDAFLELIGNAIDTTVQITRSIAVKTSGGMTRLYNGTTWSGRGVMVWESSDPEFQTFTPVDTIGNLDVYETDTTTYYDVKLWSSSLDWTPNGNLLVGSLRQSWAGPLGSKWWIMDPMSGELIESFGIPVDDEIGNSPWGHHIPGGCSAPRGGFFTDSNTLYTVDFYLNTLDKWVGYPVVVEEWSMQLSVAANSYSDSENYLGTSFGASDGFDPDIDLPEPPPPTSDYVQMYFPHPEWGEALVNFSKDLKYPADLLYFQKIWDFTVSTDQAGYTHTIEVSNLAGIDFNAGIYITDMDTEEIIQLSSSTPIYQFTPGAAGEYHFQLLVGRLYPVKELSLNCDLGWNMLSLPLKPLTNSFDELFSDDISGMSYLYEYVGSSGYNQTGNMYQGEAYWLGLLSDETLIYLGDSVTTTVTVPLREANNMVGNPFNYTIHKSDLTFAKETVELSFENAVLNSWISDALYHWNNGTVGIYLPTDSLAPWWGVWLTALTDGVSINFNPAISNKKSVLASNKSENIAGWIANLRLSSNWGQDVSSSFGMRPDASDGFNPKFDYPDPPMPPSGKYLTGYFKHTDWNKSLTNYDRDIIELREGANKWCYTVKSSNKGPVRLSWTIDNFPTGNNLMLIDQKTGTSIDMNAVSYYEIDYNDTIELEIALNGATSIENDQLIPDEYAISQNYPNPFNPVTTINYQLPEELHVTISVYNLRGQLVRTLVSQKQSAGYYHVTWDASDVGTGMYLYQIIAGDFSSVKKCIVVK